MGAKAFPNILYYLADYNCPVSLVIAGLGSKKHLKSHRHYRPAGPEQPTRMRQASGVLAYSQHLAIAK